MLYLRCILLMRREYMENLKISNIQKKYNFRGEDVMVLDDISFNVKKGEFVAIMGKSGSGKTTLLNIIGGLDSANAGNVIINSRDLAQMKNSDKIKFRRKNIGIVYQAYNLLDSLNVRENVVLPFLLDKRKADYDKADRLIKEVGLKGKEEYMPFELSGGEKQRVAVARALINEPIILLADEPTGNLDSRNTKQIMKKIKYYNKVHKQTIVMVTHDEAVAKEADRIICLEDGKIISDEKTR